eukprot:scaffold99482_cov24-Tisochrysis_lutea.AAC.1
MCFYLQYLLSETPESLFGRTAPRARKEKKRPHQTTRLHALRKDFLACKLVRISPKGPQT